MRVCRFFVMSVVRGAGYINCTRCHSHMHRRREMHFREIRKPFGSTFKHSSIQNAVYSDSHGFLLIIRMNLALSVETARVLACRMS